MHSLQQLASGEKLVYVFTRLFDIHDKLQAEEMEQATLDGIRLAFKKLNILPLVTAPLTFVPFRDTNQENIAAEDKALVIYQEDLKRLQRCLLTIGFLDGLSKDEGISFEIGYCYGTGVPVIGVFTDFLRREYTGLPGSEHISDPVLMNMLTSYIQDYEIRGSGGSFEMRLRRTLNSVYRKTSAEVTKVLLQENRPRLNKNNLSPIDVYVDFGGGQFEWESMMQIMVADALWTSGYSVTTSQRYAPTMPDEKVTAEWILNRGQMDIQALTSAEVVVICSDMEEMSPGTAALQGLARALGKFIILVDTRTINWIGTGTYKTSRNLMIKYSADMIVKSYFEVDSAVDAYFGLK